MQAEKAGGYRLSFHREDGPVHTVVRSDEETACVCIYMEPDPGFCPMQSGMCPNPVRYPLDQILLMNHLAPRDGLIVHAAGAVVGGCALVFPGLSGGGKSTLSRLFITAGLGDTLLSDDRVIMRVTQGLEESERVTAWGTPWPGDARVARNTGAPLAALLFLTKAQENKVMPLDASSAMKRLMPVVSCPWYDRARSDQVLATCARVVESLPCFELHSRPEAHVVEMLTERSWSQGAKEAVR